MLGGAADLASAGAAVVPGVPVLAWGSKAAGENTSETESIESRESVKSRETSPSHSPLVTMKTFPNYQIEVTRTTLKYLIYHNVAQSF